MKLDATFLPQLDTLIAEHTALRQRSRYPDLSDLPDKDISRFLTRVRAAIPRITGLTSQYTKQCELIVASGEYINLQVNLLCGVAESLREDLAAGYLQTAATLIRGEMFEDFLEMAVHLIELGYKDAAAVIAGSALEAHLRALCEGAAIPVNDEKGRHKKATLLNAELAKANAYGKLDEKSVTSWLDLRNNAAHGHYEKYTLDQVNLMIASVRDFIARNPS